MSTIQNIKNFIRHGKQAKYANAEPTANVSTVHAQGKVGSISDPDFLDHNPLQGAAGAAQGDFSVGAGNNQNVVARANEAAAHAAGENQKMHKGNKQDIDPSVLERLIAEERESKGKLPRYPGLERWHLVEKMGDGAFSNVYRARDTEGKFGEVAIKVVRKFEMNSSQVRKRTTFFTLLFVLPLLFIVPKTD